MPCPNHGGLRHCDRALRPGRTVDVDALTQTLAARAAANQPMPKSATSPSFSSCLDAWLDFGM